MDDPLTICRRILEIAEQQEKIINSMIKKLAEAQAEIENAQKALSRCFPPRNVV